MVSVEPAEISAQPIRRPLVLGGRRYDLARPLVLGIVNVTADSFSDGGRFLDPERALDHARQLIADGADLVDLGAESTRPGALSIPVAAEIARLLPLISTLAAEGIAVSVDSRKPDVMRAAIAAGAAMINDVSALSAPGAIEACAASRVGVCLMHMQGEPATMQQAPHYVDVLREVRDYLAARAQACVDAGIAADRIVLDPGFGFGKTLAHNLTLTRELAVLVDLGYPVLAGWSRKSSLGAITGRPVEQRLAASLAASLAAVARGAMLLRVHDVRETVDALKLWQAIERSTNA